MLRLQTRNVPRPCACTLLGDIVDGLCCAGRETRGELVAVSADERALPARARARRASPVQSEGERLRERESEGRGAELKKQKHVVDTTSESERNRASWTAMRGVHSGQYYW